MKGKPKKEFKIKLPKLFDEKIIGKTFADKPKKIIGRKLIIYAKDIWENTLKYYYKLCFRIDSIKENDAITSFVGHEVSRAFISKNVKKNSTRIDLYVKGNTKDNKVLVLKPIVITTRRVKTSVAKAIRNEMKKFLELYIKENSLDKIVKDIVSDDLQRDLRKTLNVIYPLSVVEIRKSELK
jgi:small subunit ribosomal protein S3Ae